MDKGKIKIEDMGTISIRQLIEEKAEQLGMDIIIDPERPLPESIGRLFEDDEKEIDEELETYKSEHEAHDITFLELAILNAYLHGSFRGKHKDFVVESYGHSDSIGRLRFNGIFDVTGQYWFKGSFKDIPDNEFIFQTLIHVTNSREVMIQVNIAAKKGITPLEFEKIFKRIMSLAFNHSEYKGKVIKVKLREGRFKGIEIIDIKESENELILTEVQRKFIQHFVDRVLKGNNARYLLNGEPGTGKTESIREIARKLVPHATFIIPDFETSDDLTSILEACEIFENGVIIMDDIDLYLGSRDNGSYTRLLGQFLSFFDGVKKRKISLLASTNDKGLVDKAAERPGRFNFTLDYSFLDESQIEKVCKIHLPKEWHVEEVYDALKCSINGRKVNITGAFIANLADNLKEMSEDDPNWKMEDTISLIKESYKGFYSSQVQKEKDTLGFKI